MTRDLCIVFRKQVKDRSKETKTIKQQMLKIRRKRFQAYRAWLMPIGATYHRYCKYPPPSPAGAPPPQFGHLGLQL
jgi:hypothetical protein